MGDSDDEFDRRRGRDKFRGERNEFQRRDEGRRGGGWEDGKRGGDWGSRDRNFDQRPRRFSPPRPNDSPPQKRMRRDWDGDGGGGADHGAGGSYGDGQAAGSYSAGAGGQQKSNDSDYPTQPPMKPFKAFLTEQDDNISDEDAVKSYNEYKLDFKKQQINEFFLAHKEEEWFKAKYHPEECAKKKEVMDAALKARCDAFSKLLTMGRVPAVSIDTERNEELVKLLDAAVILMEGGTDFDLEVLEGDAGVQAAAAEAKQARTAAAAEPAPKPEPEKEAEVPVKVTFNKEEGKDEGEEGEEPKEEGETKPAAEGGDEGEMKENGETEDKPAAPAAEGAKEGEEGEEREAEAKPAAEEEGEKPMEAEEAQKPEPAEAEKKPDENGEKKEEEKEIAEEKPAPEKKGKKRSRRDSADSWSGSSSDGSFTSSDSEAGGDKEKENGDKKEASKEDEGEKEMDTAEDKGPIPKALHKTQSIFLRNLDPSITKQEVESMCRQYPGFLRVGLQDPLPERRFFRRGWVTFDRSVNIKDICWNLNNIRLRDCDMGAIVNRELKQRIRPINGVTCHKPVCKADIKHAAKIVQKLDNKTGLWKEDNSEKKDKEKQPSYGLISRNPVLKNITDYLVDEGSYEEEAYLGALAEGDAVTPTTEQPLERDDENIRVLDRMVLYLRIVHSYDYYTAVEYPNEDEMPHRCGIMHARAPAPKNITENEDVGIFSVSEYNNVFEVKVKNYMNLKSKLSVSEADRLGKKSEEAEIEKFLQANTQELAKDKWLCPLSGKKFKGPEFIRKHIVMKHDDKVDEVKVETEYFNNYLLDPKRPQLPEHPSQKSRGPPTPGAPGAAQSGAPGAPGGYHGEGGFQGGGYQGGGYQGGGGGYQGNFYRGGYQGNRGNRGNWRGGGAPWRGGGYRRGGGGGFNDGGGYSGGGGGYRGGGSDNRQPRESARDRLNLPRSRDRSRDPRGIVEYRDLDVPSDTEIF